MAQKKRNSKKSGLDFSNLTAKQRQAVLVVAACLVVLIATISVVSVLVSKSRGNSDAPDESISAPQSGSNSEVIVESSFDAAEYGDAVLGATDDAGKKYIEETVFVGDSNTNLFYQNGLLDLDHVLAVDGLGIQNFASDKSIYFKKDNNAYSIPEAIAKMKPRRIIMMMGTNNTDGTMAADAFVQSYKAAIDAITAAYPYTDIIVAAVPPIPQDHANYPNITMDVINEFNDALARMCADSGLKFLNTTETLLGSDGYGKASCFRPGDIHLKKDGLVSIMDYARTHAYLGTEDRRPDTKNVPKRRTGTAGSNTDMTPDFEKDDKEEDNELFTAQYNIDKNVGGTLESGDKKGVTSLNFKDLNKESTVTVTAVPSAGYEFVKWSDGKTGASRTDKDFKQNINVTAMFAAKVGVSIKEGSSKAIDLGTSLTLHANVTVSNLPDSALSWRVDGHQYETGRVIEYHATQGGNHKIELVATVDGKTSTAKFDVHVHEWELTKDTAPTCNKDGEKVYTCKHDKSHTKTEKIEATGAHDYEVIEKKEPTCSEEGYKTFKCKICGSTYTDKLPKTEHISDGGKVVKEPTCSTPGLKVYTCTECGQEINREEIPATGNHVWGENFTKEDGSTWHKCTNPGCTAEEKVADAPGEDKNNA